MLCAVMLVGMFIGFNPLTSLTKAYSKMYVGQSADPAKTALLIP